MDVPAAGPGNALLYVVRMNDRPKSAKDFARLIKDEDIPSGQSGLRKLKKAGLIDTEGAARRSSLRAVFNGGAGFFHRGALGLKFQT